MTETSLTPASPAMSRFQLLPSPVAIPGKCACCGTSSRPVVDFGMTIEFYGAVYFCESCLTEAGRTIGMVTPAEYDAAKAGSSQSFSEQLTAQNKVAIDCGQYDALIVALRNLSSLILPRRIDNSSVVDTPTGLEQPSLFEAVSGSTGTSVNGDDESISGDAGTSEQEPVLVSDEGPNGVSASNVNGNPFIL